MVLQWLSGQPDAAKKQSEMWDKEATKANCYPDDNKEKTS